MSSKLENFLNIFDNLSYRTIGIGFCFLTLGILSGAVWANETLGIMFGVGILKKPGP